MNNGSSYDIIRGDATPDKFVPSKKLGSMFSKEQNEVIIGEY